MSSSPVVGRPVVRPAYLRALPAGAFVPPPVDVADLAHLVRGRGVVVLSGAGISTESGIPDYRGPQGALRRHTPMTYQEFTSGPDARRRYWARSFIGWRHVASARANAGHRAVATLERGGFVDGVITQNVDGLHQDGGARSVVELHGSLEQVVCLACGDRSARRELDERLEESNRGFREHVRLVGRVNPDGDVDLPDEVLAGFAVASCVVCGADALKPDVVFFGESVPRDRVEQCAALVDRARALLVLGSSLSVMSGYRFVLQAAGGGVPVAIVNHGPSRGDAKAALRVDGLLGEVLTHCTDLLGLPRQPH